MYVRLALENIKKSIKDYLIYFITITLCVSLFYAFMSLSSSSCELITEDSYNFETLKQILKYSTYVITALLTILVAYVNNYMIKKRQKEFAVCILLGAEQKNIALMFFIEMLLAGIISIALGIVLGTLFSQVITALVLVSAKQKVVLNLKLYKDTIAITFVFFIGMFLIIGLNNMRVLNRTKLINMINSEKKTEFQFKKSGKLYMFIFVISLILYGVFAYCACKLMNANKNPSISMVNKTQIIAVSLISFIIATYALFYSLSYILILLKERCIGFKYNNTNLFLIGSIVSKIKTAPMLMATICTTFLGAAISITLTLIMSQWSLGYLDFRIPYDINVINNYSLPRHFTLESIEDIPKIDYSEIINYLNERDNLKEYCEVEKYFLNKDDFYINDRNNMPMLAMGISDFNKLRTMLGYEEISLNKDEFTMHWNKLVPKEDIESFINKNSKIEVNGKKLKVSKNAYYTESIGEYSFNFFTDAIVIFPDEICKELALANTDFYANTKKDLSYEEALKFRDEYVPSWREKSFKELLNKYNLSEDNRYYLISAKIKVCEVSDILNMSLAMRILGIYLGAVLLMISLTVLALKQLADSIEHKSRFNVLRKLGVEERDINNIVLKQIALYFVVPIFIATIGFSVFIYNYIELCREQISNYIGSATLTFSIIASIGLILIIYILYFIGTYYTFKRNIRERDE